MTTNRIDALTDGVFAIAMTLLVLNLALPEVGKGLTHADLLNLLSEQRIKFFNYALSFMLLAIFWVRHHRQSHFIKRTDSKYLWMSIFFLMFVALIPFSASLVSDYDNEPLAQVFFGSNILVLGMLLVSSWIYATNHHRLVDRDIEPHEIALVKKRGMVTAFFCVLAMGLSFINPKISPYIYILIPFFQAVIQRRAKIGARKNRNV